jgi:hypothetical protein
VTTPTSVARYALLLQLGSFDETFKMAEDQDMWIRLALAGSPACVPETLVRVDLRPERLSSWNLYDQMAYMLPMIERHLDRLRSRLSPSEARAIIGARFNKIGLVACDRGDLALGIAMVLRSVFLGYQPLRSLVALVKAQVTALVRMARRSARDSRTAA